MREQVGSGSRELETLRQNAKGALEIKKNNANSDKEYLRRAQPKTGLGGENSELENMLLEAFRTEMQGKMNEKD